MCFLYYNDKCVIMCGQEHLDQLTVGKSGTEHNLCDWGINCHLFHMAMATGLPVTSFPPPTPMMFVHCVMTVRTLFGSPTLTTAPTLGTPLKEQRWGERDRKRKRWCGGGLKDMDPCQQIS